MLLYYKFKYDLAQNMYILNYSIRQAGSYHARQHILNVYSKLPTQVGTKMMNKLSQQPYTVVGIILLCGRVPVLTLVSCLV